MLKEKLTTLEKLIHQPVIYEAKFDNLIKEIELLRNDEVFQKIITFADKIFNDQNIHSDWRLAIGVNLGFLTYNATLRSGMKVTESPLSECIEWSKKIIDLPSEDSAIRTKIKVFQCLWLASIYQRRNDVENMIKYTDVARNIILKSHFANYYDTVIVLDDANTICYQLFPEDAKPNAVTDAFIRNLKQDIEFYKNVPIEKRTIEAYITPSQALLELEQIKAEENFQKDEKVDEYSQKLDEIYTKKKTLNLKEPPLRMWSHEEKWNAQRKMIETMIFLGNTYYELGQLENAAKQLLAAHNSGNYYRNSTKLYDLLKKPDILAAVKKIDPSYKKPKFYGHSQLFEAQCNNQKETDDAPKQHLRKF